MPPKNPHDKFIKDILSEPEHAVSLLQEIVPKEIARVLYWKTLKQESDSFIDDKMQEYFSDALFSVSAQAASGQNRPLSLYLLFEHKSRPDKRIHFQLLNYLARIYSRQDEPRIVIPLVFYHGTQKWQIPLRFQDMFFLSEEERALFRKYVPGFEYTLYDVSQKELESIRVSSAIRSVLQIMKSIWHIEDESVFRKWAELSKHLFLDDREKKVLEKILFYMYVYSDLDLYHVSKVIEEVAPNRGEVAMSTAQKLIEQGKQEGIREGLLKGKIEGKLETAKGMFDAGAELDFVLKATGLSKDDLKKAGLI